MTSALTQLARIARENKRRGALMDYARRVERATWEQIAEASDMSRAGAIKHHKENGPYPETPGQVDANAKATQPHARTAPTHHA